MRWQLLSAGDDPFFFWSSTYTARLKLQLQSGTPLFKSLDPPLLLHIHLVLSCPLELQGKNQMIVKLQGLIGQPLLRIKSV